MSVGQMLLNAAIATPIMMPAATTEYAMMTARLSLAFLSISVVFTPCTIDRSRSNF